MANASILAAFERMWKNVTTKLDNKSDVGHTHDVATQTASGFISSADKTKLDYGGVPIVTTEGTGEAYTATVDGITALTVGAKITIIPHTVSTKTNPTLDVNGLGAKYIRMPITYNTSATSVGSVAAWLAANKPVTLEYDGTYWKTISLPRPSAQYLYGAVPIANGGTGATTAAQAIKNLGIQSISAYGTSGIWTYRQYSDGIVELWATITLKYVSATTLQATQAFPLNLKKDSVFNVVSTYGTETNIALRQYGKLVIQPASGTVTSTQSISTQASSAVAAYYGGLTATLTSGNFASSSTQEVYVHVWGVAS